MSPTNKLFRGGEKGKQDKEAVMGNTWLLSCRHWLALLIFYLILNTFEAHREMTGRKYTKTFIVTFSRDGEIATNLISSYPFSIFHTVYNDHILLL